MALPASSRPDEDPEKEPILAVICPICAGKMDTVYHRHHQRVVVCVDCQSGLTVPTNAWDVARAKRESKRSA
jgi:ssDNA-binding Zn-finger/Zn-ribbon topoisomerase 1